MITVVNLDETNDVNDARAQIRKIKETNTPGMSLVVIGTAGAHVKLLKGSMEVGKCYSVVLDKIDLLQAFGFKPELEEIAEQLNLAETSLDGKIIITSSAQNQSLEDQSDFKDIKNAYMGDKSALQIQLNEVGAEMTDFEQISHLYSFCKTSLDKFILLFSLVKLAMVDGKTLILVKDITQAYRIKFFLQKFSLTSFVIAQDMAKNQVGSILHFFHIGQFNLLIMLHSGYGTRPPVKEVTNVINFDMAPNYNGYKENGMLISEDTGCILSLATPGTTDDIETLKLL